MTDDVTDPYLTHRTIYVFGSNLAGNHEKGSALHASRYYGAREGVAIGLSGDAYGIPVRDEEFRLLPFQLVRFGVFTFLRYSEARPSWAFLLTHIGVTNRGGGYPDEQMARLFFPASHNLILPSSWRRYHSKWRKYGIPS